MSEQNHYGIVEDYGFEWYITDGFNYDQEMVEAAIVHAAVTGSVGATEQRTLLWDSDTIESSVTVKRGERIQESA